MKKLTYCSLLFFSLCLMNACKKEDVSPSDTQSTSTTTTPSTTAGSSFSVKYEITTSEPLIIDCSVVYQDADNKPQIDTIFAGSSSWSKTITVTSSRRPYTLKQSPVGLYLVGPGTITSKIYVNGTELSASAKNTINSGYINYCLISNMGVVK